MSRIKFLNFCQIQDRLKTVYANTVFSVKLDVQDTSTISGSYFIYLSIFVFYNLKWPLKVHRHYYFYGIAIQQCSVCYAKLPTFMKNISVSRIFDLNSTIKNSWKACSVNLFWFLTEEIQYHDGLRSRELGQAPILLCAPNS